MSDVEFGSLLRKGIKACNRFNELAARVMRRGYPPELVALHAPLAARSLTTDTVGATSRGRWFNITRLVLSAVALACLAVLAVLMVMHRRMVQTFWVALLVLIITACCLSLVFAGLTNVARQMDSVLSVAVAVGTFVLNALLASIITLYATLLCRALYAVAYRDRGPLTKLVFIRGHSHKK